MQPIRKEWRQFIPRPLAEVWAFFSRPENLNDLTPNSLSFDIISPVSGEEMYEGMIIQYKISPFLGIKMNWVTEITSIVPERYFIDDQRIGPYALWHHQHHFEARDGGTLMRDVLHYQVPFGPLGALVNAAFVERQINHIFAFRERAVAQLFGISPEQTAKSPNLGG